jgi:hypothetical protein
MLIREENETLTRVGRGTNERIGLRRKPQHRVA